MKYLSLFSGIEAASQAWQPLGWQPVAFAEIEPFPCAVLAHHYPEIPNLGDVSTITQAQIAALGQIDVVVGGSPCTDLSIAGKRADIAGKQSSLFHELVRIFHAAHTLCGARFLVWENVPGTLSVHQGRDFALVAGTLAGCDLAVLDTRRWADRPPILLERDSLRGDCPARGKQKRHDTVPCFAGTDEHGGYIPDTSMCLNAGSMGRRDFESETFIVHGTQDPITSTATAHALGTNHGQENVVCAFQERGRSGGKSLDIGGDIAYCLTAPSGGARTHEGNIQVGTSVRRLTPKECERLQGFPDDYTLIPWHIYRAGISRNDNVITMLTRLRANIASFFGGQGKNSNQPDSKECPDGPRYKALGNSMAVPVMRWIGQQIDAATNFEHMEKAA